MDAAVLGSLISAGSSLAGGLMSNVGLNKRVRKQMELNDYVFKLNEQSAKAEFARNVRQWERENEYNSPVKQMERLAEAGLNPNLIYGSTDGGTSASSPNFNMPRQGEIQAPDYSTVFRDALNSAAQGASLATQYAQNSYIEAQTQKVLAETARIREFNLYSGDIYRNQAALGAARLAETQANVSLIEQKTNLTRSQAELVVKKIDEAYWRVEREHLSYNYDVNTYDSRVASCKAILAQTYARIANIRQDTKNKKVDYVAKHAAVYKIANEARRALAQAVQAENNPLGASGETGNLLKIGNAVLDEILDGMPSQSTSHDQGKKMNGDFFFNNFGD